jgi:hypothetical protein
MEGLGASIYAISIDIGAEDTHITLFGALEHLSLPLFLGVIHASGILEDSLLIETTLDSFAQVLSLKTSGAIALHRAFPLVLSTSLYCILPSENLSEHRVKVHMRPVIRSWMF